MSGNYVNYATAENTDALDTVLERLRLNNLGNQMVDDAALLKTGLSVDTVVKYSSATNQWEACDGTVALTATDVIGIVTYVDGTTDTIGQVKVGGVYVKSGLAVDTDYYCQSDGSINTTETEVLLGKCCAAGRLVLKISSVDAASVASAIAGTAEKATPVDADSLALIDSADGDALKEVLLSALKTYMQGIKLDDLTAPDDNTDLDATTSSHGLLPKLGGGTTNFLRADGSWSAPSGGQPVPTTGSFAVGTLAFLGLQYNTGQNVSNGSTTAGSNLSSLIGETSNGEQNSVTTFYYSSTYGTIQTGTWKNVSGYTLSSPYSAGGGPHVGYWVRTA